MTQTSSATGQAHLSLPDRLVRYRDLKPCTTAFIDTRTPGSAEKENFTIIGPGVAENPDQYVHIDLPHGFNIGGARQPPGCVNSQHSHETAEVFFVHSGTWDFILGAAGDEGRITLEPGDTISIPVHVFRGFENTGNDTGFLIAVLGGDDPGHVTWAPYVFDQARRYGLVLLEDGSLVDTTQGETIPAGKRAMRPTTADDVAALRYMTAAEIAECVVRHDALTGPSAGSVPGVDEYPIIGADSAAEGLAAGKMAWPHGFHVRLMRVAAGAETPMHIRHEAEVLMLHEGQLTVATPDGTLAMEAGDVLTLPIGLPRQFKNTGTRATEVVVVRGTDTPRAAELA